MNRHTLTLSAILLSASAIVACGNTDSLGLDDPNDPGVNGECLDGTGCENNPDPNVNNPAAMQCAPGREYKDFGGSLLTDGTSSISGAKRWEEVSGVDRDRLKPYSALETEFPRVLGSMPKSLAGSKATLGEPVARWYQEPQASAIGIYTTYRVAFDGCLDLTDPAKNPKYATAPDATTAAAECSTWALKFWSRTPTPADIALCVKMATTDSAKETVEIAGGPDPVGTPKDTTTARRWAYTCATVLTSAGFLAY